MAVLSLVLMRRCLITCPFSNMPGGHSRSHFSERFRFQPESQTHSQGFQKDAVKKVKLSRNPLYKYWWGSCRKLHCWKMLLSFGKRNEEGTELFWKPSEACGSQAPENMMLSSEMLYQCFEGSMEGNKCKVEVHLCLYGLFWRISSHTKKPNISWHLVVCTDNLCFSKIKPLGL